MIIKKILRIVYHWVFKRDRDLSGTRYWQKRAQQHGRRSVFNLRHPDEELDTVTQMQKNLLFPILRQHLRGDEHLAMDFGCGPGRFTPDLAECIQGKAFGVDPIKTLLDLAPPHPQVEYRLMKAGRIPIDNDSLDVVWICIVLGGITDEKVLRHSITEINRVLKKGGLLFLVENTTDQPDQPHWKYRSVGVYQQLFSFIRLMPISDYFDLEERLSIMVGRKIDR